MPFFKKAAPTVQHQVFSALVSQKNLQALYWEVVDDHIEIIAQSQIQDYAAADDASRALDLCLQEFGPESESVNQIFFHLDSAFSDYAGLRPEKAAFIKKITRDLNLEAAGFTANVDALEQVYQSSPNSHPYHLIIEYISDKAIWSLFNRGSLIHEKTLSLHGSSESKEDVLGALAEMKQLIRGNVADNLEIWCISGLISSQELRDKNLFADDNLLVVYFGNEVLLEKVVPPSAVALARENGWLAADVQTEHLSDAASISSDDSFDDDAGEPALDDFDEEDEHFDTDPQPNPSSRLNSASTPAPPKKHPHFKKLPLWLMIVIGVVVVAIIAFAIFWISLAANATAEIIILPKTARVQKTETIKIDPSASSSDFDNLILAGSLDKESLTSSDSAATTGKKDIGAKATGRIKIINKDLGENPDRTFAKGVQLNANGQKFVLEEEVFVTGRRADTDNPGEATVRVSAVDSGTAGNLAAGTKLSLANFDNVKYEAEAVDGGLTGGTSETVAMVTETDQSKLAAALQEQMITDAPLLLNKSEDTNTYYIILAKQATVTKKTWSTPVGEQADELGLELTLSIPIVSYSAADLAPLANAILDQEVPEGYALSTDKPSLLSSADDEQAKSGEVSLKVDMESTAVAQPNLSNLTNDITGLDTTKALSKIRALEGVSQVEIKYSSAWYSRLINKLPKPDNITVTTSTI